MAGYVLSVQARADLREIATYTQQTWGADQARKYRQDLRTSLSHLAQAPALGRARDEVAPGLRSFQVGQHIAFYRQTPQGIVIARLLHPSRDIERHLGRSASRPGRAGRTAGRGRERGGGGGRER